MKTTANKVNTGVNSLSQNTPSTMNANENVIVDFETYCKDYIKDHINDYVGDDYYMCDLGSEITDGPNCDGTLTYSRAAIAQTGKRYTHNAFAYVMRREFMSIDIDALQIPVSIYAKQTEV